MGRWFRRVLFWCRRRRLADELRQEIETHRALRRDALERAGAKDAAAGSQRALGNVALALEDSRDVWIWPWLDSVARDVRYGARALWRQPGFAIASILTIAVGTGALASVLSVVHAVLLRPAPYPNANRIVQIAQVTNGRIVEEVSTVDILALREGSPSLSHVTIAWFSAASLAGGEFPEQARLVYTDSQAFALLGVQPVIGRLPAAADEAPDAEPVVVIGHRLWSQRFALDRGVIGRTVRVDGLPHIIIGVMPSGFAFPAPYWARGDLWLMRGPSHPSWPDSRARLVLGFGLVKEGRTIAQAQREVDAVASALDARYPDATGTIGLRLTTWAETVQAEARPRLWLILGAACVVFLIVCGNVANLLLSRVLDRQRELAARVALGAGRTRIFRQLLTETAVLFGIGGCAGVLAAIGGSRLIVSIQSNNIPRMDEATVDAPVAVIAMAITLAAAFIVGLVSALHTPSATLSGLVEAGARGASRGRRWRRIQRGLVAVEIGLTLVLLCGAGVLLEGARNLARIDPGFDVNGLLHARVSLPPEKYANPKTQAAFYTRVIDGLLEVPWVIAAGAVNIPPGVGGGARPSVMLEEDPVPAFAQDLRRANVRVVSPGYLEALGLAPRMGRFFLPTDPPTVPVAIVNEAFVRQHLENQVAVGRRLRVTVGRNRALDPSPRTIVGVVADLKERTLYEPAPPTVYLPLTQADSTRMALLVRSARSIGELIPVVRTAITNVDPDLAAAEFMAVDDLLQGELSLNRLNLALLSVLATVSLFLAVIGVYGVTAQVVRQRTREIGIRLALGISPRGVQRLLLGEGGVVVLISVACGSVAAIWSAGLLRSLVPGIDHTSASTFLWAGLVLATAVLAGSYFPARRAARIDPAIVLRSD